MIEFLRLILHIMASFFKPRTKLVARRPSSPILQNLIFGTHSAIFQTSPCLFAHVYWTCVGH